MVLSLISNYFHGPESYIQDGHASIYFRVKCGQAAMSESSEKSRTFLPDNVTEEIGGPILSSLRASGGAR